MKVSFVIPSFNQARFLRRCLDSCLAQQVADAEVIVIDGASTDGTQQILETYGTRIRWVSEPDRGQGDAVNKGVAMASGDLIAWINSDDAYASPRVLRTVLDAFEQNPGVDLLYGDGVMVDESGEQIRPYPAHPCRSARDILLHPSSPFQQPAAFFKKALFLGAGGLDTELHWALDYDLWLRMLPKARRIVRLQATLAHATYHADAKSIRGMREQIRETCRLKMRYAMLLGLGRIEKIRLWTGMLWLWVYWAVVKVGLRRAV